MTNKWLPCVITYRAPIRIQSHLKMHRFAPYMLQSHDSPIRTSVMAIISLSRTTLRYEFSRIKCTDSSQRAPGICHISVHAPESDS
ncbi:hypothetical protein AB205_0073300 [Aquarana catesbeiana]|uniref:Uncharacterized protein n=1 Tax=Aquarana catesbeiana TaxID=8400 RepID=A0A2G9RKR1_AQUCT|nr:hypothetical protein AB205_0073300 [Aquarana catesbeiana]